MAYVIGTVFCVGNQQADGIEAIVDSGVAKDEVGG